MSHCPKKKILFLVNGYGLGNSTRIHSIIQHIDQDFVCDIFGFGNSVQYFKQVPRIQNIFQGIPMEYGLKKGRIDFFATMGKLFKNLQSIYKNRAIIKNILKAHHYSLLVSDSNFSALLLRKRPKLISINNAGAVLKKALKIKKSGHYTQFFIEWADYIYNLTVPDLIISPFFHSDSNTKKRRNVGIMARKEFHNRCHHGFKRHHILIMAGGNESFQQGISINHSQKNYDLSVLGDHLQVSGKAQKRDKTFNTANLMSQSTIIVINGGFSSISEALSMARPMIVIPIKGHIEQKINALYIQENNLGLMSSWEDIEKAIERMIKNYTLFKKNLLKFSNINGAKQAVSVILKKIQDDEKLIDSLRKTR